MLASALLVLALWVPGGLTYGNFRTQIPNGDHVPHPCKPNFLWHGVGHQISQGGGARNPFGVDFHDNGNVWTEALCRKDSDGDGLTNGQELGDPDCMWRQGQPPQFTKDISHPGVCDPWNDAKCVGKNDWLDCSRDEVFDCEYINDPAVLNITLRFPRTKVPAQETTYICFNFELPSDRQYHVIASKPFIDNHNVMHHMALAGCDSSVKVLTEPESCEMGSAACSVGLAGWTLGQTGECMDPMAGILMGKGGSTMASLQLHWTNPELMDERYDSWGVTVCTMRHSRFVIVYNQVRLHWTNPGLVDEWFDSSGVTVYYTPKLRPYNAAQLMLGQNYLNIPPGQPSVVAEAACTARCTSQVFKGDVHVMSVQNHMHYLGIRQNVTLKRANSDKIETLVDENPFSYDTPKMHVMEPTITIRPGDELRTSCTFQSHSRTKTTTFGLGSFEEMCFAFLVYYPAENILNPICTQWKDEDICDGFAKCDFAAITDSSSPAVTAMIDMILDNCDPSGSCLPECPAAVEKVRSQYNCLTDVWGYMKDIYFNTLADPRFMKFANAMDSCGELDQEGPARYTSPAHPHVTTAAPLSGPGNMLMNIISQLDARPLLQNIIMNVNYNNAAAHHDNSDDSHDDDDHHAETWH